MGRNSVLTPPQKDPKSSKKHSFSSLLSTDSRVKSAPRHVFVLHEGALEGKEFVFITKIYAALDTPGSELLTVSCIDVAKNREVEMRFDERYAISIRFRTQSDEERVAAVSDQIKRTGGFERLLELVRSNFPKFGV